MTPTQIAQQLGDEGFCVCPDFLNARELIEVRKDLLAARTEGQFRNAGIGTGRTHQIEKEIRRDEVYWLDRAQATRGQALLWAHIDLLQTAFNRTLFLGLRDFNGHYASYPAGGFYQRHLDALAKGNNRVVSVVMYLNEDWKAADGGQLRIYDGDSHTDIDPIGGTLVCFMSEESEHEVRPSLTGRLSFTGWFTR